MESPTISWWMIALTISSVQENVNKISLNLIYLQITSTGKCTVKQAVSPVALELHICEFRLRMSDTLAIVSPFAEASLLDGDSVLLEDATRVRDERGGIIIQNKFEFRWKFFLLFCFRAAWWIAHCEWVALIGGGIFSNKPAIYQTLWIDYTLKIIWTKFSLSSQGSTTYWVRVAMQMTINLK